MTKNRYIRFDWAAKYMLHNKADFAIFEGLISVLVGEKVTIVELLESESNKVSPTDKYNRVDIKAKNSDGEIVLVEIQQSRELDYLRMSKSDRKEYDDYVYNLGRDTDVMKTKLLEAKFAGLSEGRAEWYEEGRAEGRAEGIADTARKMMADGMPTDIIVKYTGLSREEIEQL